MPAATPQLERRAPALAAVEEGWLVCRRWPLDELPPAKQQAILDAYDATGWSSDTGIELFGFYTDHETALREAAKYPGGFIQSLPVNASLPAEHRRYGIHQFPNSSARDYYEDTSPGLARTNGYDRKELERVHAQSRDLNAKLKQIAS